MQKQPKKKQVLALVAAATGAEATAVAAAATKAAAVATTAIMTMEKAGTKEVGEMETALLCACPRRRDGCGAPKGLSIR